MHKFKIAMTVTVFTAGFALLFALSQHDRGRSDVWGASVGGAFGFCIGGVLAGICSRWFGEPDDDDLI